MARVTVSLPDELLAKLDDAAGEAGISRSEVIREASTAYITRRETGAEAVKRRKAVEDGIEWMRKISRKPGLDGRPTLEILGEVRDTDDAAPPHRPPEDSR